MLRLFAFASSLAIVAASLASGAAYAEEPLGVVFAVGDLQYRTTAAGCLGKPMPVAEKIAAEMKNVAPGVPVRILALGDLAYNNGTITETECFMKAWGALVPATLPVPGNHENDKKSPDGKTFDKKNGQPHMKPFLATLPRFPLLSADSDPGGDFTNLGRGYYFTSLPPSKAGDPVAWRFMALNPYADKPKQQWTDLKKDLDAHKDVPCIIGFMHPFRLSSGYHGHGDSKTKSAPKKLGDQAKPPFEALFAAGASLVLSGHDHNYEQFARTDIDGKKRPNDGLRSFVVGSGGFDHRPYIYTKHTWAGVSEHLDLDSFGVLKLELYDRHYRWQFLPLDEAPTAPQEDTCNTRR